MATTTPLSGHVTASDGTKLRYTQEGPPGAPDLVFLPGWAQSATIFRKQVDYFKANFRVTTYDHRGHGESDKPAFGYHIARLAADLETLLSQLDLHEVTLIGHSMGATVVWSHWELYAHDRIARMVVVDMVPVVTSNPGWSEEEKATFVTLVAPGGSHGIANALTGLGGEATVGGMIKNLFTPDVDQADMDWVLSENLKLPLEHAAALFIDHAAADWRPMMSTINVPTLLVLSRGEALDPFPSVQWMASQIPESKLVVFEKGEKGSSHFMFWESPERFNRELGKFLASS
ncbi:Uu.00g127160.m01.CDS01 [Anthostomella pinea]|uniref:Uu.00g127160.m01.CDS01 n=1 Tax=Anthostomella pinea TaxID=933095 RepID=A0AAI8VI46_9PEZI|nr:Uu.00g127160.m01.CDS01 [Anthostomella pinea]